MTQELYKRYRPGNLDEVIGQVAAVKELNHHFRKNTVPHAILLTGPSGCGKTTIGRIVKSFLGCHDADFFELNAADTKGIDTIREIRRTMGRKALGGGRARLWLIDEAAKLTGDSQDALLKMLEDTPKHVYFVLATTDPIKLKATIKTRCTEIKMQALPRKDLETLVMKVAKEEGSKVTQKVCDKLTEVANGSARKALVLLEQVLCLDEEGEQLEVLQKADVLRVAFDLIKTMLPFDNSRPNWPDVAKVLSDIEDEEPEGIRMLILKVARGHLLKSKRPDKMALVIRCFRDPYFDNRLAGLAYLASDCWDVCTAQRK